MRALLANIRYQFQKVYILCSLISLNEQELYLSMVLISLPVQEYYKGTLTFSSWEEMLFYHVGFLTLNPISRKMSFDQYCLGE